MQVNPTDAAILAKQMKVMSDRLQSLPKDPQKAIEQLRNIGNELSGIQHTGLSHADLEESGRKAGPGGGRVTVAGQTVEVAPPVNVPFKKK